MVWVSCAPEDPGDQAHLGAVEYSPWRGFPKYYFPIRSEPAYLAPIVAVQFLKPASKSFGVIFVFTEAMSFLVTREVCS